MRAFPLFFFAAIVVLAACGSDRPEPSAEDPAGCGLPVPCLLATFTQGSNRELQPQDAASCMFAALTANKPAHLTVQFKDLTVETWDFYTNGVDPAVIVRTTCELHGPCEMKSVKRCNVKTAAQLDCSKGSGPQRVCGDPASDWCSSSREIDALVCP